MTKIYPSLPDGTVSESKPVFTYADLIIDYLGQIEVEYIYGIPGGAIEGLFDALARRERGEVPEPQEQLQRALERKEVRHAKGPQLVVTRHEAGAAFMADGYARETGKLGVCCSTTGPGATNLLTGVANAYVDRVPMLVITPQTALPSFGQRGFQESSSDLVDVVAMFDQCTRYSSMVSHPDQLEAKLCTALATAFRRPRGPVHLSIPADILSLPVRNAAAKFNVATLLREPAAVDDANYQALLSSIDASRTKGKEITVLLGEDCGDAAQEVIRFAELVGASIVTTPAGKRWISAYHRQNRGVFGFAGHDSARRALTDDAVELVLAIGTSFGELDTAGWDTQALLNDRLVHIASSVSTFDRSPMAYLHVYGNLRTLFARLLDDLAAKYFSYRREYVAESTVDVQDLEPQNLGSTPPNIVITELDKCTSEQLPIKPQRLMCELTRVLPKETKYVIETGNAWSWAIHYLHLSAPEQFHIAMGFGAMGWAIGAAPGVAMAAKGSPVACITGDGAYLMSGQEITVAKAMNLPVIYVVLNDQALGMVKHGQQLAQAEQIGVELPEVDYAAMARAMGIDAYSVRCWEDMLDLKKDGVLNVTKPMLLDVYIDGGQLPPMKSRMEVLQSAKHVVTEAEI